MNKAKRFFVGPRVEGAFIIGRMPENNFSLLFLGKANDPDCARALDFCRENFLHVAYCLGQWGDPLPEDIHRWEGDYIV